MDVNFKLALHKYTHPEQANIFLIGEEREMFDGQEFKIVLDIIIAAFALPNRKLRLDITTSNGVVGCFVNEVMEEAKVYSFLFRIREKALKGYVNGNASCNVDLTSSLATSISRRPLFISSPDHPAAPVEISNLIFSEAPDTLAPSVARSDAPSIGISATPSTGNSLAPSRKKVNAKKPKKRKKKAKRKKKGKGTKKKKQRKKKNRKKKKLSKPSLQASDVAN